MIHVSAVRRLPEGSGMRGEKVEAGTRRTRRRRGTEEEEIGRTADGRRTKALLFSYERCGRPSLVVPKLKEEDIERRGTNGRKGGGRR